MNSGKMAELGARPAFARPCAAPHAPAAQPTHSNAPTASDHARVAMRPVEPQRWLITGEQFAARYGVRGVTHRGRPCLLVGPGALGQWAWTDAPRSEASRPATHDELQEAFAAYEQANNRPGPV